MRWDAATPPEWKHADEKALEHLRRDGVCPPLEKEYLRRDGTRVPVLLGASRVPGDSGQVVAFAVDMTERKRAEEALKKAHDELEKRVQERTSELADTVQRLQTEILHCKRLEETLRESEIQVRLFASQCLTAQETERRRIAAELHDSIAASLAAIRLRIERAAEEMKQRPCGPELLQDIASSGNRDQYRGPADHGRSAAICP